MQGLKNIQAVIFDLGNVIIDIDYDRMLAEFTKIAAVDFHQVISYQQQIRTVDHFEKGQISAVEFRDRLRSYLRSGVTDEQIDDAWNSILINYPSAKFELLKNLRKRYRIYALSNINELHLAAIDVHVQEHFGVEEMRSFFDRAYYSHELGLRKPEKEIYQLVLENESLDPARTLFIDDKLENTDAAAALGIQVHHLTDRDALLDFFVSQGSSLITRGEP